MPLAQVVPNIADERDRAWTSLQEDTLSSYSQDAHNFTNMGIPLAPIAGDKLQLPNPGVELESKAPRPVADTENGIAAEVCQAPKVNTNVRNFNSSESEEVEKSLETTQEVRASTRFFTLSIGL
ncbi:hypothetical protein JTB14_025327 [Gonioctena quinquepunctata]|nr:hypothetical protein JTB14_025327 [Gonioctena quinquepunctata]